MKLRFLVMLVVIIVAVLLGGRGGAEPWPVAIIPVASGPRGVAVESATNRIYVACADANVVSVIDGATDTVVASIALSWHPAALAVNPTTSRIYVVNMGGVLFVIDGATNTVADTIRMGNWPRGVAVNPTTNRIYVANYYDDNVWVIDGASHIVGAIVPVGDRPRGVAVNPTTNRIYVANSGSNNVSVIDGATSTVVDTVPVGTGPLAVAANATTDRIYVVNSISDNISVIDGAGNAVVATVSVGKGPRGVAVNAATNRIYVTDPGSDTVWAIDGATDTVVAGVPVDWALSGVAVNPATNRIYVAHYYPGTVWVIEDPPTPMPEVCDDGIDNDGDGDVDCDDDDCEGDPACPQQEICDDGIDNDGDTLVDCDDPGCVGDPACPQQEICDDGIDNDGDTLVDCDDSDCVGDPACPELLPDLSLSPDDITFSNPNPALGETVTITATIHNEGEADANNVRVQFFRFLNHDDQWVNSYDFGRHVNGQTYLSPSEIENVNHGLLGVFWAIYYSWPFGEELGKTTAPGIVYSLIESIGEYVPGFDKFKEAASWYGRGKLALDVTAHAAVAYKMYDEAKKYGGVPTSGMFLQYERWGTAAGSWRSGDAQYGDRSLIAEDTVTSIHPGTDETLNVEWKVASPTYIIAKVDPANSIEEIHEDNNIAFKEIFVGGREFIILGLSPTDFEVTDPDGLAITKTLIQVPDAAYAEYDLNDDGDPDDLIFIPDRKMGNYQIAVIPEPDAELTDTYTVSVSTADTTLVVAENVPISQIPDQPYIIRFTDLVQGWSYACYLGSEQPVADAISADVQAVYRLAPGGTFEGWFPDRADASDIVTLNPYDALFILMGDDATWIQEPSGTASASVNLAQGWNSVCYRGTAKPPDSATLGIAGDFAILYMLGSDQAWTWYAPDSLEVGNIAQLDQYDAVLLLMTETGGTTWTFDQ